jgi:hypothetical protein
MVTRGASPLRAGVLYATNIRITIDEDVRQEYRSTLRSKPAIILTT